MRTILFWKVVFVADVWECKRTSLTVRNEMRRWQDRFQERGCAEDQEALPGPACAISFAFRNNGSNVVGQQTRLGYNAKLRLRRRCNAQRFSYTTKRIVFTQQSKRCYRGLAVKRYHKTAATWWTCDVWPVISFRFSEYLCRRSPPLPAFQHCELPPSRRQRWEDPALALHRPRRGG